MSIGSVYRGRSVHGVYDAPWTRSPNVTSAWSIRTRHLTFLTGNENDGSISTIAGSVGSYGLTSGPSGGTINAKLDFNSSGKSVHCAKHAVGSSSRMSNDTVAASQSGTAVPLSVLLAGRLPQAPNNAGATETQWCLFSFGSSISATPFYAWIGSRGSTSCVWQRRNDANSAASGSTIALGTSPFVLLSVYDGSNVTTRLNGTVIDNAASGGGGALTVDQFTIGAMRNNAAGLHSDMEWTNIVLGVNKTFTAAEQLSFEAYARRKLGI